MRNRVEMLLQVLNRANPDGDSAEMATGMKNVSVCFLFLALSFIIITPKYS
jgi:hypothetical protein